MLRSALTPGATIEFRGALGDFVPAAGTGPALLIAGGIGGSQQPAEAEGAVTRLGCPSVTVAGTMGWRCSLQAALVSLPLAWKRCDMRCGSQAGRALCIIWLLCYSNTESAEFRFS